jgi:hypothetical protein
VRLDVLEATAEEQVWLMSARPDLTPNQGKRYQLKQILFQANPERFQAFLAGELDETARVTVEAGPVEYEKRTANNTLTGRVTFGI